MHKYLHSLQFRLLAFGLLLAGSGIVIRLVFSLPFVQQQVQDLAAAQQMSIATYVANDVGNKLASRRDFIGELAQALSPELLGRRTQLQSWLQERQRLNPLFNNGLVVVPVDGHGLLGEFPIVRGRDRLDYTGSDWFRAALASSSPVVGKPARGRATGAPLIIMAAAVRDGRGQVVAVLAGVALLNAPGFLDLIEDNRIGKGGGLLLISPNDGIFVAAHQPEMILQALPAPGINPLHDRAMAGFRGSGVTVNAHGTEELAAIASVPGADWFVVARLPTSEAFQPVYALREYIIRNSIIVLLVVIVVLLTVLPRMFRPLSRIAHDMRCMADGAMPLQALPVHRDDEVGDVIKGFNHLVAQLIDKEKALEASRRRLDFMAHHDPLTGLPNRNLLEDRLEQALARCARGHKEIALLFCDLDGFKPVNDQYGHETGDRVLQEVADRLGDGRRRADTVARLGGDEFVVLLGDLDDARSAAAVVASQCIAAIAAPFTVDGQELHLGLSIGIAIHRGASPGVAHLLSQADSAMYAAKNAGKGRYAFFGDDAPA